MEWKNQMFYISEFPVSIKHWNTAKKGVKRNKKTVSLGNMMFIKIEGLLPILSMDTIFS
jgi:hypothetical protein